MTLRFAQLAVWKAFAVRRTFGPAIALLAGVFLGTIATAKKNKQYLTCHCNNIIDISGLQTLCAARDATSPTRTDHKVKTH
jgi:hypothetical protein